MELSVCLPLGGCQLLQNKVVKFRAQNAVRLKSREGRPTQLLTYCQCHWSNVATDVDFMPLSLLLLLMYKSSEFTVLNQLQLQFLVCLLLLLQFINCVALLAEFYTNNLEMSIVLPLTVGGLLTLAR